MTLEPMDPYKILQVDPDAETEVIVAAYRRLARKYHPDVATGPDADRRMAAINAAWELIGKPARRVIFDRERRVREARLQRDADAAPPANSPKSSGDRSEPPKQRTRPMPEPEAVSRDWTAGRSSFGGGYDESMHMAQGEGAAGPPPGRPSGSVLNFGRYNGWSLGEIGRSDLEYIEWLDRTPIGRPYRDEIDAILRQAGRRVSAAHEATERRGLFRRR